MFFFLLVFWIKDSNFYNHLYFWNNDWHQLTFIFWQFLYKMLTLINKIVNWIKDVSISVNKNIFHYFSSVNNNWQAFHHKQRNFYHIFPFVWSKKKEKLFTMGDSLYKIFSFSYMIYGYFWIEVSPPYRKIYSFWTKQKFFDGQFFFS